MRARLPNREGYVESHGTRIFWEEHGQGDRAVLFIPAWQIVDSRVWKMQIPYFARYFRTITFDPPGNGRSERPATGYDHDRMADHTRAVLDAAGVERAALVCLSRGAWAGTITLLNVPWFIRQMVRFRPYVASRVAAIPEVIPVVLPVTAVSGSKTV